VNNIKTAIEDNSLENRPYIGFKSGQSSNAQVVVGKRYLKQGQPMLNPRR
jgi:hypothetical protein